MSYKDFPPGLVKFISGNIESVEQVLIIQLLQSRQGQRWTVAAVTKELRSAEGSISRRLDFLCSRQILNRIEESSEVSYSYFPHSKEIEKNTEQLLSTFKERPSRLIELIYSKPNNAISAFSDAFKFRNDDE